MSNRGSGLATVALLIGIGGAALGLYSVFFMPNIIVQQASGSSEITKIWTVEQSGIYYPYSSLNDVTDMDVTITVAAGETVYVMFDCIIRNEDVGGSGYISGDIRVMIDTTGTFEEIPESRRFSTIDSPHPATLGLPMTTHFLLEDLDAGTYELKVQAAATVETGTDRLTNGLLVVYTFR